MNNKTDVRQRARELLRQAASNPNMKLNAKEGGILYYAMDEDVAIRAIEAALSSPAGGKCCEQAGTYACKCNTFTAGGEAVAWMVVSDKLSPYTTIYKGSAETFARNRDGGRIVPLYTHPAPQPVAGDARCNMGVGCEETGLCYAAAHGQPERCGKPDTPPAAPVAIDRPKRDEAWLRAEANRRGWYTREGTSVPTLDGDWRHPFEVTIGSLDLLALIDNASQRVPEGCIPASLDEAINGAVVNLEMFAAGRDTVTGDKLEIHHVKDIATDTLRHLVPEWSKVAAPPPAPCASDDMEFFALPPDLHPNTANLVARFATSLAAKLAAAEKKYGYSNGWVDPNWMDECRQKLAEHVAKGDPRDVAAYCAFLWHHGESTTPSPAATAPYEGCTCQACGLKYTVDLMVPDDVWARISNGRNLLCPTCLMTAIADAGIWSAGRAASVDAPLVDESDVDRALAAFNKARYDWSCRNPDDRDEPQGRYSMRDALTAALTQGDSDEHFRQV
jgi:hypothetical protein